MKRVLFAFLLLAICGLQVVRAEPIAVTTVGRALNAERPDLDRVGALRFRGALEMTSSDERFGGLSGLEASPDGRRLSMVSDRGTWFSAELHYDDHGRLSGLQVVGTAQMRDLENQPLRGKELQDAEAVTSLLDGTMLVAFEHAHRLWRYDNGPLDDRHPQPWPSPEGLDRLPYNDGLEALATLPNGGVLAIAQHEGDDGHHPAFLWDGRAWQSLSYPSEGGFQASGAAALPGGDLLVLERRFSWLGGLNARLMRVPAANIRPGALLQGMELATFQPPLINDNWEGLATAIGPRGETLIYMISDDNFLALLSNYLVMFELIE